MNNVRERKTGESMRHSSPSLESKAIKPLGFGVKLPIEFLLKLKGGTEVNIVTRPFECFAECDRDLMEKRVRGGGGAWEAMGMGDLRIALVGRRRGALQGKRQKS